MCQVVQVSGDLNPGQWPILRPYVAASNEAGTPQKPSTALQRSYLARKLKSDGVCEQCWIRI